MQRIAIFFDGTGNEIGDGETNVLRLYKALVKDHDQLAHYILGVGTDDGQTVVMRPLQKLMHVLGLAFGWGLEDDVLGAYRYLCRKYRSAGMRAAEFEAANPGKSPDHPFDDDRIYIFGFSRGAYAARVLAGFIHNFGLVAPDDLHLIVPVFRAYRRIAEWEKGVTDDARFKALRQFGKVLNPVQPPIRALCLFDTVTSMIRLGWPLHNLKKHQSLFELGTHANVCQNGSVRIVLHALAIDERRTFFRALPWETGRTYYGNRFKRDGTARRQYVAQRWFPGFHSDIGGSPREDRAGIGKITALWMLDALADAEAQADDEDRDVARAQGAPRPARHRPGLALWPGHLEVHIRGGVHEGYGSTNPGGYEYSKPDPLAPLHDSVFGSGWIPRASWLWLPLEVLIKSVTRREPGPPEWFRRGLLYYLPLLEPRTIPPGHEVDGSAFQRREATGYDPENLRGRTG